MVNVVPTEKMEACHIIHAPCGRVQIEPRGAHEDKPRVFEIDDSDEAQLVKKFLSNLKNQGLIEYVSAPAICPVCGKECKNNFGLRSHMRTHND